MKLAILLAVLTATLASAAPSLLEQLAADPNSSALRGQLKSSLAAETNDNAKVRSAVIYVLASRHGGHIRDANKAMAYLQTHFSGHPDLQMLSLGSTGDPCATCAGVGEHDVPCKRCTGNGKCRACQGGGKPRLASFDKKEDRTCFSCKGSGRCGDCKGSAKRTVRCTDCRGSGFIEAHARLREAMTTLATAEPAHSDFTATTTIALATTLKQFDQKAASLKDAPTAVLKNEAVNTLQQQAIALFSNRRTILTATVKDVHATPTHATITLTGDYHEVSRIKPDLKHTRTFVYNPQIHLTMPPEAMRTVLPGTTLRVTGTLHCQGQTGPVPPSVPGREIVKLYAKTSPTQKVLALLSWKAYTCEINGKTYILE
ncbi:MAG: hypothetical protein HN919_07670 [Verrucomicrobia bacterium]|nr:hypothetical protein [Verrucomicrobiota bacterium]